jgi:tetratricopeptide (TPR) repeat protein
MIIDAFASLSRKGRMMLRVGPATIIRRGSVIGLLATALCAGPAFAASQQDWTACSGQDPALAMAACSRIIANETETKQDRADAYLFRASAHLTQRNFDPAIADYTGAAGLTPGNIVAYASQALAYSRKGDHDNAAVDLAIAKLIDARGLAQITAGNPEIAALAAAVDASPVVPARPDNLVGRWIVSWPNNTRNPILLTGNRDRFSGIYLNDAKDPCWTVGNLQPVTRRTAVQITCPSWGITMDGLASQDGNTVSGTYLAYGNASGSFMMVKE